MLRILHNLGVVLGTAAASIAILYFSIPTRNTGQDRFDVILVLGHPTNDDGSLSPQERECVLEAVREYHAGVAPNLLFTGGAVKNTFVESRAMADFARSQGVPASAIFIEQEARNTVDNAYYSFPILKAHQWDSAMIITVPSHVRRASLIFRYYPVAWQMRAAPWPPEKSFWQKLGLWTEETVYTAYLRVAGFSGEEKHLPRTRFTPPQI